MFSKMMTRMQNMTWKDWLVVGLWLLTFALLLAFVIAAATMDKDSGTKTVDVAAQQKYVGATLTKGSTAAYEFVAPASVKDAAGADIPWAKVGSATAAKDNVQSFALIKHTNLVKGVTYNNILAGLGLLFMISIFSALISTVMFKYLERKRGAN